MRLCLGLLLLLGWGTTQGPDFSENSTGQQKLPELKIFKYLPFSCNPKMLRANISSVSVNALRPSDVKLVASIGFKGTLSFPSTVGVMEKLNRTEERSQELCLGVGKVLSDIIRFFNPTVLRPLCIPKRQLTSWADTENLWIQATELVKSMKENSQLDFKNDWKLINVFISNANECYLCPVDGHNSFVTSAISKLTKTLNYLYQKVPRSFVNLVDLTDTLDFSALPEMRAQDSSKTEFCKCSEEMMQYKAFARWSYQETWERILASSKYNQEDSFSLVLQPFFYETDLTRTLMQQPLQDPTALGLHLWNSMEHPYLFTYRNSNYQPRLPITHPVFQPKPVQLQCPDKTPSRTVPRSVHKLKPADIKVVAAVGDSLMANARAGFMPQNFNRIFNKYQGLSWRSLGGNETLGNVITLPNILRQFNSKLTDYNLRHGKTHRGGARLNQMVSGVISMDMSHQVLEVIRKMKSDRKMNYKNDWKLLTMFIGVNDLCHSCTEEFIFSPENFKNNIQNALDILHKEVPRMVVNVVSPLEIISLRAIYKETGNKCPQYQLMKLCPCVMKFGESSKEHYQVVMYNKQYQQVLDAMVMSGRYDTRDDFTVVLQPFFERFEMPRTEEGLPDLTYFDRDCFHFSQKTLGHAASALWNNMLEPVGQKSRKHNFTGNIDFACPTQEQPFLRTSKNSAQNNTNILQCQDMTPSSSIPTSVHLLKPADIKVIAALGDSITAGTGAASSTLYVRSSEFEFLGLSFSIGGDLEFPYVKTLPNILRKFNNDIKGYSLTDYIPFIKEAGLNQATTESLAKDFQNQTQILLNYTNYTEGVNLEEDWKIITAMIGYQDFCTFCNNPQEENATEQFINHVRDGLDYLHTNMPRALVNLLYFFEPMVIRQLFLTQPKICLDEYRKKCPCLLTLQARSLEMIALENMVTNYRNSLNNLIWSGRYDTRDDFTVVLQPFLQTVINSVDVDGKVNNSLFSSDCNRISQEIQGKLAYALWNNMFEELGNKTEVFNLNEDYLPKCPGEEQSVPFVRTKNNSNYEYPELIQEKDWGADFPCDYFKVSPNIPSSAHSLQPADIKVVAAMGDWVTTARESSPFTYGFSKSWKYVSWSIGGRETLRKQATLPNILRKFTSSIYGISFGSWPESAGLNFAEDEARVMNMPEQADKLVESMEVDSEIDFDNDWKLITIFIGINDLCDFCMNKTPKASENFYRYMHQTLDIFFKRLPKVFINLVEIMDVISFYHKRGGKCSKMPLKCPCFESMDSELKDQLQEINVNFQKQFYSFSFSDDYKSRKDFVVVAQPFFRASTLPRNDKGESDPSYFSDNCQYFSSRMQSEMAIALWNNMLEPVGYKSTSYDFSRSQTKIKCPDEDNPYFFTEENSGFDWLIWLLIILIIIVLILLVIVSALKFCKRTVTPSKSRKK